MMQRIVQPFSYFFLPNSVLCFVQLELLGQKHNKRDLIMSDPMILFCTMVLEQRIIFIHLFTFYLF